MIRTLSKRGRICQAQIREAIPQPASTFGFPRIALAALGAFVLSWTVLWLSTRRSRAFTAGEILAIALAVGASVLFWRLAGNPPALNDDPIPPISPNDVLCPIVTYVALAAPRRENNNPLHFVQVDKTAATLAPHLPSALPGCGARGP